MDQDIKHILQDALELPPSKKAELVNQLLASLDEPDLEIDALWEKEAEERVRAYEKGEIRSKPLREVLAKYHK